MRYQRRQYGRVLPPLAERPQSDDNRHFGQLMIAHADHLFDAARRLVERYQRERALIVTVALALAVGSLGGVAKLLADEAFRTSLREQFEGRPWFIVLFGAFSVFFVLAALGLMVSIQAAFKSFDLILRATNDGKQAPSEESSLDVDLEDNLLLDDLALHEDRGGEVASQELELSLQAIEDVGECLDSLSWEVFDARYSAAIDLVQRLLVLRTYVRLTREVFIWSVYSLALATLLGLAMLVWMAFDPAEPKLNPKNQDLANPLGMKTDIWYGDHDADQAEAQEEAFTEGGHQPPEGDDSAQSRACQEAASLQQGQHGLRAWGRCHHRRRPQVGQLLSLAGAET